MALLILSILFLPACNPFNAYAPDSEDIVKRNFAKTKKQPLMKLYCYRTLADHQCVLSPIKGREDLLVGEYIVKDADIPKDWWEKLRLHSLIDVDANTIRNELNLEKPRPSEDPYVGFY